MNSSFRNRLVASVTLIVIVAAAIIILNRQEADAAEQSTDDAYIQADLTVVAPQVSGVIAHVDVAENESVAVGDSLVGIDESELRVALEAAKAQVAGANASVSSLKAQLVRQQNLIEQSRATVSADLAKITLADADRRRFEDLAKDGSGTVQAKQQADAHWEIERAAHIRDVAQLHSVEQQVAILHADLDKADAALKAAQARQAGAELNLSYARIKAPVAGVVAQRRARVGNYVHTGEALLTIVPLDALYVEANFRETQLARMRVGQEVSLSVDALPGIKLRGMVESLGPASGVSFSTIPPHNATGNFTKIVQRLPVRISLHAGQEALKQLRVGMSVHPQVQVSDKSDSAAHSSSR